MTSMRPVQEQVVVLFGASSGMGRAAALRFARAGARVVIAARSAEALAELAAEIEQLGGTATAVVADTADAQQAQAVADRAVAEYGRIDTWVQLAAVTIFSPVSRMTPAEFKQVIDVDLTGAIYGALAALSHMRPAGRGALVFISSILAKRAVPYQSAYCAAKHGLDGFLEALRSELQHEGLPISVTAIMPSTINTPLYEHAVTKLGVLPNAPPPVYAPDAVVDAILYAAANPARDIVVGAAGEALLLAQRLSPSLLDALIRRFGFDIQHTDRPKSPDAPANLYAPLTDDLPRSLGAFTAQQLPANLFVRDEREPLAEAVAELAASATNLATGAANLLGAFLAPRRLP
jgi:NAD(P)-dependent dehydrogenase (short-subunit alcohol dehydrogenase family)